MTMGEEKLGGCVYNCLYIGNVPKSHYPHDPTYVFTYIYMKNTCDHIKVCDPNFLCAQEAKDAAASASESEGSQAPYFIYRGSCSYKQIYDQ